ncbi:MAG TPA: citrate/2-methylcitrate synthase [Streptosporangiaceae bacterium]|nr:citrate/2-methylcitrate synthase [Streptosporangiaceae bacterium]
MSGASWRRGDESALGAESRKRATEWIGAAEAAARLGIKPASLYAYVSRGTLSRRRDPGGRGSLFDAEEIARLARKGRPRRAPAGTELLIESSVTEIAGNRLRYRGHDVVALARQATFEEVAVLLWTGTLDGPARTGAPWQATPEALAAGTAAQAALPAGTLPLERLQVIVPALAATDPLRLHLDRPVVVAAGHALIAGLADCLSPAAGPRAGAGPGAGAADLGAADAAGAGTGLAVAPGDADPAGREPAVPAGGEPADDAGQEAAGAARAEAGPAAGPGSVAARLARALCPGPVPGSLAAAVQTALVLTADHELAASTLAARVAASVRADPYAVVATGLGAVGGALHGGAALGAEVMLNSAQDPAEVPRVVGDLLRRGERIPGFGHFVYKTGDPRAAELLQVTAQHAPDSPRLAVARAVIAEARRRALPDANIDFALATLTSVAGMVPGAGEAIFAVARTAGWLAHALEEYERRAPIRPRSIYIGPAARIAVAE